MNSSLSMILYLDKRDVAKAGSHEGLMIPIPPNTATLVLHIPANGDAHLAELARPNA